MDEQTCWVTTNRWVSVMVVPNHRKEINHTTYLHPATVIKVTHKFLITVIFLFEQQPIEILKKCYLSDIWGTTHINALLHTFKNQAPSISFGLQYRYEVNVTPYRFITRTSLILKYVEMLTWPKVNAFHSINDLTSKSHYKTLVKRLYLK